MPLHMTVCTIYTDVDQQPKNVTVLLGRQAAFHCSSVDLRAPIDGSSTILWFRNQTLIHQLPPEYNASSVTSPRTDVTRGENSTLTVLGSEQTNGTRYRCGILDVGATSIVEYSALITLSVQGMAKYKSWCMIINLIAIIKLWFVHSVLQVHSHSSAYRTVE